MKYLILISILVTILFVACNNEAEKHSGNKVERTLADTLLDKVNEGHDVGMSKMGKLTRAEQEAQRILDSISNLPAKAQKLAEPYKQKVDSLLSQLKYAESAMDKWMNEFRIDSAANNAKKRIEYLSNESETVQKVKQSILSSLAKADSLIKKKI